MVIFLDDVVFEVLIAAVEDECDPMPACGMLSDATPARSNPYTYCISQRMLKNDTCVYFTTQCTPSALHMEPVCARESGWFALVSVH